MAISDSFRDEWILLLACAASSHVASRRPQPQQLCAGGGAGRSQPGPQRCRCRGIAPSRACPLAPQIPCGWGLGRRPATCSEMWCQGQRHGSTEGGGGAGDAGVPTQGTGWSAGSDRVDLRVAPVARALSRQPLAAPHPAHPRPPPRGRMARCWGRFARLLRRIHSPIRRLVTPGTPSSQSHPHTG